MIHFTLGILYAFFPNSLANSSTFPYPQLKKNICSQNVYLTFSISYSFGKFESLFAMNIITGTRSSGVLEIEFKAPFSPDAKTVLVSVSTLYYSTF